MQILLEVECSVEQFFLDPTQVPLDQAPAILLKHKQFSAVTRSTVKYITAIRFKCHPYSAFEVTYAL